MSSTSRRRRLAGQLDPKAGQPVGPGAKVARAADLAGEEVRRLAATPAVRRAVGVAREAARSTAGRLPRAQTAVPLRASDLAGVPATALLLEAAQVRAARKTARALRLPRVLDGAASWAALGGLAALVGVADDGRRHAVVVDPSGPRSAFSRWAASAGFAPVAVDVTVPDVVGEQVDAGAVDLVALLHPRMNPPEETDVDLVRAGLALRRGGLVSLTVQLGPAQTGGVGVADLRALIARAGEQGMHLVGDLDLDDVARARAAQQTRHDRPVGLALLTFRRR